MIPMNRLPVLAALATALTNGKSKLSEEEFRACAYELIPDDIWTKIISGSLIPWSATPDELTYTTLMSMVTDEVLRTRTMANIFIVFLQRASGMDQDEFADYIRGYFSDLEDMMASSEQRNIGPDRGEE